MLFTYTSWALVLSAAFGALASPSQSASDLQERQLGCPEGLHCGPGPVCTAETCDLPGCVDADVCQDIYQKRQWPCPEGMQCGHGPACNENTCDWPACADADVCSPLKERAVKPSCDICIKGPNSGGKVCGCAIDAPVQRRELGKRCPQYCIETEDGQFLCGCAAFDYEKTHNTKRKVCPQFCIVTDDGDTVCGCAAEDYEKTHHPPRTVVCPQICVTAADCTTICGCAAQEYLNAHPGATYNPECSAS
ncbi:MAG: hypothetical protein Q9191_002574 [Dirinaria sp. TL-2023a]